MGHALFVVWRECLEAFLIVGILYAWFSPSNDPRGGGRRALFAGLGAGVGLALLLGWGLLSAQDELAGNALDVFQTGMLLFAALLVTQMVLWMRRHGRRMKAMLHAELSTAASRSGYWGVTIVAALTVAREGAETVIFLYGLSQGNDPGVMAMGALAGLLAAAVTAMIAARSLARLNISVLLRLSSFLLLLLASALLVAAMDRMVGSGWIPAVMDPVWDSSAMIDDTTTAGKLLADFSGYRARPALSTLLAWFSYWAVVLFLARDARRS